MPKLYNKRAGDAPRHAVYIGRPSPWGNPFSIGQDGDRAMVIQKYRAWLSGQPQLQSRIRRELAGCDLVCFCAPLPCHGEVILELLDKGTLDAQPGFSGKTASAQMGLF